MIFLDVSVLLQLAIALYYTQVVVQYLVVKRPMIDTLNNFVQIFNEVFILCCCIFVFNFTFMLPDPITRYELGWFFLYIMYSNVGVNVSVIIGFLFHRSYVGCKQRAATRAL